MGFGRLLFRLVVGMLFVGHGLQKLFGWFEGPGLRGAAEGFEGMGLRPGKPHAVAASMAETGGGAMLAAGFATPAATAMLSGTMMTAIRRAHLARGVWNTNGGFEYPLALITALALLTDAGPGRLSLDSRRGHVRAGTGWAAAALGAGGLGALAVHLYNERQLPAPLRTVEEHIQYATEQLHRPRHEERLAA
jgi:putative oxidoreductase